MTNSRCLLWVIQCQISIISDHSVASLTILSRYAKMLLLADCENNFFLKKSICIMTEYLHCGTKLSGWLRHWFQIGTNTAFRIHKCYIMNIKHILHKPCNVLSSPMLLPAAFLPLAIQRESWWKVLSLLVTTMRTHDLRDTLQHK